MSEIKYSNYNFDLEKILLHVNKIKNSEDKIYYLNAVINDCDTVLSNTKYTGNIVKENETIYNSESFEKELPGYTDGLGKVRVILELEMNKLNEINKGLVKETAPEEQSMNKIFVKSGITDIVRIFEAMKKAGIISGGTTDAVKIARIFFHDPLEAKKFQASYNAIKREIINNDRNSNSDELTEFIKLLIENSFTKKETVLEDFIKHIERLQKNII